MKESKSQLNFNNYLINYFNFEENKKFDKNTETVKLNPIITHNIKKEQNKCEVTLNFKLEKIKDQENTQPFFFNMSITGFFEYDGNIDNKILEQNTIAILYPYMRSVISNVTLNLNVPPIILPTMNIIKYLENQKNKKRANS